ncbi:Rv3654c family TadE-like protein [Corynebacterium sp.]|uniref:Rv3654c family TadE-like protein n=1 Tax=Corynebacterium sp. TaxID=1720 RepID=UPI002A90D880|nr:Rv3654c family TadE-like protein [Corynebacterium sp.]MDY5784955.1 Rv3654c family TadE-like protein [Corynebacterium sp.]
MRRLRDDDGYATVVSAGIIAAVVSLLLVVAALGTKVVDSHRARVAADLAAVAGAFALYAGSDPCRAAEETAQANGGAVQECSERAPDVTVTVRFGRGESTARAGPL